VPYTQDSKEKDGKISEEAQASFQRLLASETFSRAPRLRAVLKFFIDSLLAGRAEGIHEQSIGHAVFGRPNGYSQSDDNIVRVNVRLLRVRLEEYYRTEGRNEIWQIAIPKGRYVPEVVKQAPTLTSVVIDELSLPVAAPTQPASKPPHIHWLWFVLLGCVSVSVLFAYLFQRQRQPVSSPAQMASTVPYASFPGQEMTPAWAPDGNTLAYTWDEGNEGNPHVFLQRVGEAKPHRLTRQPLPEFRPAWSPDGKQIAYLRPLGQDKFTLVRHRVSGDAEAIVATISYFWPQHTEAPALDWSPDGSRFVVSEQPTPYAPVRLALVDAATGKTTVLSEPHYGTSGDFEARFSPDGALVAFRRGKLGDLYTVSTKGESKVPAQRLTSESMGVRGVAWSGDGRFIFFASHGRNGRYSIWKIAVKGGVAVAVSPLNIQGTQPATSKDGRYLAFEHHDLMVNLVEEGIGSPSHKRYLSPSNQLDGSPAFSPDGNSLAFTSNRSGFEEVWVQKMDESALQQITTFKGAGIPLDAGWSPDGASIVMAVRAAGATNLFTFTFANGTLHQLTSGTDDLISPLYSKDGKYIYCSSNDEGATRIWRVAADGSGKPEHMFGDVAEFFQQSDDGQYLYFVDSGATLRMMRRNIQTGALDPVYQSDRKLYSPSAFAVRGDTLYMMVSTSTTNVADLVVLDLNHGTSKTVSHLEGVVKDIAAGIPILMGGITISPNGQSYVVPEMRHSSTDIYLLPLSNPAQPAR
jgi:Tol biopolymer transport system component